MKVIESKESLSLIRETNELPAAESVVYDKEKNILYVSCQAADEPGDGSIAKVSLEGEILNPKFTAGLNNPKGIAIVGDKLYVADLLELVEINRETGDIIKKYTEDSVKFLNDVTVDKDGNVYVSDMFNSAIYKLDKDRNFKEWFISPEMENPNGLLAIGDEIYLAGWGRFTDGKPAFAPKGCFQKINMNTMEITKISADTLGNLDGIQVNDENSFIVSDWRGGKVFRIAKTGETVELLALEQGVGDILFLPEKGLLVLPMKKQNQILFYEVK
jgi:sugar lactone lactonase YvrE